jgi:FHA domain
MVPPPPMPPPMASPPPVPPLQPTPVFPPSAGDPMLMAVDCPYGHSNPPNAISCRVCGTPIPPQGARLVGRPVLAVVHASDGGYAELDRPVLIGRAPDPSRSTSQAPRLLTVQSPGHDISRTHLEVAPDGWQIVVTDLHSTNGTTLIRPGGYDQQRLTPGEPVPVQLGSVLELGDGVSVAIGPPH